ncbi:MAG: response regulator, partial [Candidatus Aureabacteria bacterium]|nr:response regulator [Candidatus Auribacterota bacterium]
INMPKMNGIETLKALKKVNVNIPIIVISGIKNKEILRSAINEGAETYLQKPFEPSTLVHVVMQVLKSFEGKKNYYFLDSKKVNTIIETREKVFLEEDIETLEKMETAKKIIVIGASAGGPKVLSYIVSNLSKLINAAIVIVQHIPFSYSESLVTHLKNSSSLNLKEAEFDEVIKKRTVYLAKGGYHTVFKKDRSNNPVFIFNDDPPIFSMKPAINPTMISAAEVFKDQCLGVILTGMGIDGTQGAKAIKNAGGKIIAQNEETSEIYGMPRSINELKLADEVLPPEKIIERFISW